MMDNILSIWQKMTWVVFAVNDAAKNVAKKLPNSGKNVDAILPNILNLIYTIAGLLAVGYIIYAGYSFTRSEGDAGQVNKARQSIFWAMAGLFMVVLGAVITNFIIFGVEKWTK